MATPFSDPNKKKFLQILTLIVIFSTNAVAIKIVFDVDSSPPDSTPADADRIFSISLGHTTSKPLVAYLYQDDGTKIEDLDAYNFSVATVDAATHSNPATPDSWATDGILCLYSGFMPYPTFYEGVYWKFHCSNNTIYEGIPVIQGKMRADGLIHRHPSGTVPSGPRVYVYTIDYQGTTYTNATNSFEITGMQVFLRLLSC